MLIMKELWDPFKEMENMRKEMNRMFENFWSKEKKVLKGMKLKQPAVDIENKKNEVVVKADLPGIDKKDLEVNVSSDRVEIKAKVKKEKEVKKKDYYKQERAYSGFYRAFSLPAIVNPDKAKTGFKNGMLKINLPKVKEIPKKKTKKLAIK